jgi:hypothetical protein
MTCAHLYRTRFAPCLLSAPRPSQKLSLSGLVTLLPAGAADWLHVLLRNRHSQSASLPPRAGRRPLYDHTLPQCKLWVGFDSAPMGSSLPPPRSAVSLGSFFRISALIGGAQQRRDGCSCALALMPFCA